MHKLSACDIADGIKEGKFSAVEVTEYHLKRAKLINPKVDALTEICDTRALEKAKLEDQKSSSERGFLSGVPIIIKDNIHIKGLKTTCASKILENYMPPFDATVVKYLQEQGAILIAKANLDEFAMGSTTEHSAFMKTKNPWDLNRVPGGSSGGSAASVASLIAPLALGSDTGGSIRQPASLCSLFGFKPTYGRVSRFGLVAFGSSLDQIGPFARNVKDIALIMQALAKPCKYDSTSLNEAAENYLSAIKKPLQNKRIGVPYKILEGLSSEIRQAFDESMKVYESLGATVTDCTLDLMEYATMVYYIIATAEASTNLARYDGVRYGLRSDKAKSLRDVYEMSKNEGFGTEVKQRILLGTYVLSSGYQDAYYIKAQKVRMLMKREYEKAFASCDVIALPTSPITAPLIGQIQDPLEMYLADMYTLSANLVGIPAISCPMGFSSDGLPMGFQIQGPQKEDARVMQFAHQFEKESPHSSRIAPLFED
jgi:aspartyl-tRNA(Asn)/glutamyl-tRNA(Gln) amidotransferase subunit A